jgi:hypothetical protein
MAIVFLKELDETKIKLAYNNNIVRFYTDSGIVPINATIQIGLNTITLFPDPNGIFYYNFKDLVTTILNTDNFTDDLETDISTTLVYDWTDKISLTDDVVITINLSGETTETDTRSITWLSGYVQLQSWKQNYPNDDLLVDGITLLQKKNGDSYYDFYLNYWKGYPFDLTVYGNDNEILILNKTNASNVTFTLDKISRVILSDGRTDTSIEDTITLQEGVNDLDFDEVFNLRLNKLTDFCTDGIYIKWINSLGGWNYWLFSKGQTQTKTKDNGSLNNDFNNLEDTISPLVSLGKTSETQIKVQQKRIIEQDKTLLSDLLDSAKVYLFTGMPFSQNTFNDWIEVNLTNGTFTIENPKSKMYQFNFNLELPPNITRNL